MKKYFIVGTDEEIQFGDKIELDLTKKTRSGVHKLKAQVELSELSIPLLLELEAIEEREELEEEDENSPENGLLDFTDENCEALESLMEDFEALEKRLDSLEKLSMGTHKELMKLVGILIKEEEDKKNKKGSPNKKHE